ncbi:MAG: hypothetical protein JKY22_01695 [Flavobacteriaceae bacterium]|nr:hypothetical protein [Flavobacteriaceae bacterium]
MKKEGKYKHGMKVPEGYFENFEERLATKISEETIPKTSGFKVPSGYFDAMEDQILQQIKKETTQKVIPLYKRKSTFYFASIAACLLLMFSIFTSKGDDELTIEVAEIEAYFNNGSIDFESEDIAQLLSDNDLESLPMESPNISLESLEDCLLENLDDTTLLIE